MLACEPCPPALRGEADESPIQGSDKATQAKRSSPRSVSSSPNGGSSSPKRQKKQCTKFSVRTILEKGLLPLVPSGTPSSYWDEICISCYCAGEQTEVDEGEDVVACR